MARYRTWRMSICDECAHCRARPHIICGSASFDRAVCVGLAEATGLRSRSRCDYPQELQRS